MMARHTGFTSLAVLIEKTLRRHDLKQGVTVAKGLELAQEFLVQRLSPEALERIKPVSIKNGVLTISCASSSAAAQIKFFSSDLIQYINSHLHKTTAKTIRTVIPGH